MDEQEDIRKEMIFYLSECVDISIKAAIFAEHDPDENTVHMEILKDILDTIQLLLDKMDSEKTAEENSRS